MKTKLQRILSICVLVTCIMAPISVLTEDTYINCLTCMYKTALLKITYSDWKYDSSNHWKIQYAKSYCTNPACTAYGKEHPEASREVYFDAHNHNTLVNSSLLSTTNLNASQHQKKYKDTKKCKCGHQITSTRTVNENHTYRMQSQTKSNGYLTTTYKCSGCGRTNVVKTRIR